VIARIEREIGRAAETMRGRRRLDVVRAREEPAHRNPHIGERGVIRGATERLLLDRQTARGEVRAERVLDPARAARAVRAVVDDPVEVGRAAMSRLITPRIRLRSRALRLWT
jgi:hypothetical protein